MRSFFTTQKEREFRRSKISEIEKEYFGYKATTSAQMKALDERLVEKQSEMDFNNIDTCKRTQQSFF
ncbi:MAG: hypothetical protein HQ557_06000 [Bacteroidetes bacterium]|nr:hypothetical protein [Bacteroidota bacterium]